MNYFQHQHDLPTGETLEIQVRYRKDHGVSWYDGHAYKRGLVLDFTPVKIARYNGYVSKTSLLGDDRGRIIFLEDLKRQSDKKGKAVAAFVEANIQRLAEAGAEQDWDRVITVMREYYA